VTLVAAYLLLMWAVWEEVLPTYPGLPHGTLIQ